MKTHRVLRTSIALLALVVAGTAFAACGSDDDSKRRRHQWQHHRGVVRAGDAPAGLLPERHPRAALVGIEGGIFEQNFAENVTLETNVVQRRW